MNKQLEIDVRYEPEHEGLSLRAGRPMLTWQPDPDTYVGSTAGEGWVLWFLPPGEEPDGGIEHRFIGGDLLDVDAAVESARRFLADYARTAGDAR
ncbi:MAG TPA: hypothetical protein VFH23_01510 [Jiangellaceae bacterium]|nr:hypothetical protein [Jiangellaceae bacterium]